MAALLSWSRQAVPNPFSADCRARTASPTPDAGCRDKTMRGQGRAGGGDGRRGHACLGLDPHGTLTDPAREARRYL
jgi:hypothetical protein